MERSLREVVNLYNLYNPHDALENASTIPAPWYFDARIAELERKSVFSSTWQVVGRADQVRERGQFLTAELAGEPLVVVRGDDGQLRKISIPLHYLYVFVIGAAIGFLSLTGIASSYTRMLLKVSQYNQLRTEKDQLKDNYSRLEQVAKERDMQVASLGSIAGEV